MLGRILRVPFGGFFLADLEGKVGHHAFDGFAAHGNPETHESSPRLASKREHIVNAKGQSQGVEIPGLSGKLPGADRAPREKLVTEPHHVRDTARHPPPSRDVVVVHSSDIHVEEEGAEGARGDGTEGLRAVLAAARAEQADLALLVGDTFEHQRVAAALIDRVARLLAEAGMPIVILPGNHDPAIAESVYRRGIAAPPNVHVLGVTHEEAVWFPELHLEIWGHAHRDYGDMDPLRMPRARRSFWQIAAAHGHYEPKPDRGSGPRPSWLIGDDEIVATGADYVALGHWNRAARVGNGKVPAYYSGSPDLAGTVNVVRLAASGRVLITRSPVLWDQPPVT